MAMTSTTLAAALSASSNTLTVTSATNWAASSTLNPYIVLCEHEYIGSVLSVTGTTIVVGQRGAQGTAAVAHDILSPISIGLPTDFPNIPIGAVNVIPPSEDLSINYGASGAIAVPAQDATITLNKAGVGAMTLVAPTGGQTGLTLTILATSAQAHTVTNTTPGFNNAGTSGDVATFGGAIGDNFVIKAENGIWDVITAKNVTFG